MRIEGLQSTKEKWGILEPGGDGLHHTAGVMASRTPVDLEQTTVPVLVLNRSEEVQRIKNGVAVAACTSVQRLSVLSNDGGGGAKTFLITERISISKVLMAWIQ